MEHDLERSWPGGLLKARAAVGKEVGRGRIPEAVRRETCTGSQIACVLCNNYLHPNVSSNSNLRPLPWFGIYKMAHTIMLSR